MTSDTKEVPKHIRKVVAKWYSFGYTPSFTYCPACEKSIGYHPKTERCWRCNQRLIWEESE